MKSKGLSKHNSVLVFYFRKVNDLPRVKKKGNLTRIKTKGSIKVTKRMNTRKKIVKKGIRTETRTKKKKEKRRKE